MALFQKRFSSFGREDRASGVMAWLKIDSIVIRLVVFIILGGIFYLVVQATHKAPRVPVETGGEQPQPIAPAEKQPATK